MSKSVKDWIDDLAPSSDYSACILFPFSVGLSKLTESQAISIRDAKGFHKDIARNFSVSIQTVGDIKRGRRWAHLS